MSQTVTAATDSERTKQQVRAEIVANNAAQFFASPGSPTMQRLQREMHSLVVEMADLNGD